mgnify:CR=1 FL=1
MIRVLLTTTSFQDTPGPHQDLLQGTGWEIIRARGPLNEADTLALVGDIDAYICGDDMITRRVLEKARPRLQVVSKYGIGIDKIAGGSVSIGIVYLTNLHFDYPGAGFVFDLHAAGTGVEMNFNAGFYDG